MQASGLGLHWGDVPAWVGSVLTGVALLIAATTYRKSVRDSGRAQASMVTVWVKPVDGVETVHVKNGSNASVYAVTVYYGGGNVSKTTSPYYDIRDEKSGLKGLGEWPSIGPGEQESAPLKRNTFFDPEIPWLYFRDANGVDWIRDYRARLERHDYTQSLSELWYSHKAVGVLRWLSILDYVVNTTKGAFNRVTRVFKRKADRAAKSEDELLGS